MKPLFAYLVLSLCINLSLKAQEKESWMEGEWPQFALTNHVAYQNGDSYVHPSFKYAGTGFLINYKGEIFAATAKHVLWIAKNNNTKYVEVNKDLKSWTLISKSIGKDSIRLGKLINEDTFEILEGPNSTIMQRDWLVFKTKVSTMMPSLKPRFSDIKKGEKVYILECPYEDDRCLVSEGKVLRKEGMDISIERVNSKNKGGASGSPVIDKNGYLVGILSSSTTASQSLKNVTVAVSTKYLKAVLEGKEGLNKPKIDYGQLLLEITKNEGSDEAIRKFKSLMKEDDNYDSYNLRDSNRNGLRETGEKLMELEKYQEAADFFKMNVKMNPGFFRNYNQLAEAYLKLGNKKKAIKNYTISTERFDIINSNDAFAALTKLKNI